MLKSLEVQGRRKSPWTGGEAESCTEEVGLHLEDWVNFRSSEDGREFQAE